MDIRPAHQLPVLHYLKLTVLGVLFALSAGYAQAKEPVSTPAWLSPKKEVLKEKIRTVSWIYGKLFVDSTLKPRADFGWLKLAPPIPSDVIKSLQTVTNDKSGNSKIEDPVIIREILKGLKFKPQSSHLFLKFLDSGKVRDVSLNDLKEIVISWEDQERNKRTMARVLMPFPQEWWASAGSINEPILISADAPRLFSESHPTHSPHWEMAANDPDIQKFVDAHIHYATDDKDQCQKTVQKTDLKYGTLYFVTYECKKPEGGLPFAYLLKIKGKHYVLQKFDGGADGYTHAPGTIRIGNILNGHRTAIYMSHVDDWSCGKIYLIDDHGNVSVADLQCTPSSC